MTYYPWRQAIGKRGELNRRVVDRNGRPYHVTKGWRGREPRSDVAEAIAAMQADMAKVNARMEALKAEGPSFVKWPSPKDLIAPDESDTPDIAKIRAWEDALDTPYVDMVFDGVAEPTLPRILDADYIEDAREKMHARLDKRGIADMPVPSDEELRAMQARGELASDEDLYARRRQSIALDVPTLPRTLDTSDAENALDDATAHLIPNAVTVAAMRERDNGLLQMADWKDDRRSYRTSELPDDIKEAIVDARMSPEHDHLNDLLDPSDFQLHPLPIAPDPIIEAIAHWSVDDYLQARGVVKTLGEHTLSADELGRLVALRSMVAVYEDDHGILSE